MYMDCIIIIRIGPNNKCCRHKKYPLNSEYVLNNALRLTTGVYGIPALSGSFARVHNVVVLNVCTVSHYCEHYSEKMVKSDHHWFVLVLFCLFRSPRPVRRRSRSRYVII